MLNTTLAWNGLNKSESFMIMILKVNPIQIGLSKGLLKAKGWEWVYKKGYVDVREMKLRKRV